MSTSSLGAKNIERDDLFDLYDRIDTMLSTGKMSEVNSELSTLDITDISATMLCGWLTITFAARHLLPSRVELFNRVYLKLLSEFGEERTNEILRGLR